MKENSLGRTLYVLFERGELSAYFTRILEKRTGKEARELMLLEMRKSKRNELLTLIFTFAGFTFVISAAASVHEKSNWAALIVLAAFLVFTIFILRILSKKDVNVRGVFEKLGEEARHLAPLGPSPEEINAMSEKNLKILAERTLTKLLKETELVCEGKSWNESNRLLYILNVHSDLKSLGLIASTITCYCDEDSKELSMALRRLQ